MRKRVVYVAGPCESEDPSIYRANCERAARYGLWLARLGYAPIIPHSMLAPLASELSRAEIMSICLELVGRVDALLAIGDSDGTRQEIERATSLGVPVYRSIDELIASCPAKL